MSDLSAPRARRRSLAREVADGLVEQIAGGRLQAGDRLPPEPALAELLGVSRSSVREAVRRLQAQGIVRVVHGRGTFVLEARPSLLVPDQIVDLIVRSPGNVEEIHEARLVLELGIAELAARRATRRDVDELRALVAESRALLGHGWKGREARAFELGLAFHLRLAEAARNPLLQSLYAVLVEPLRRTSQYRQRRKADPAEEVGFHAALVDALERHDAEAAVATMRRHVEHTAALVVPGGADATA